MHNDLLVFPLEAHISQKLVCVCVCTSYVSGKTARKREAQAVRIEYCGIS